VAAEKEGREERMTSMQTSIEAVRKSVVVSCPVERAFEVFTREIGTWWPKHTHSIGEEKIVEVVFEERIGGRIVERLDDGTEGEWGRLVTWDPPEHFVMSWYPGREPSQATELEVRFSPEGEGTRVELEHRGWEILGQRASEIRSSYESGWSTVLGYYTEVLA
jgi:Activator of Hsp90 ATPase homolog 1-like protein